MNFTYTDVAVWTGGAGLLGFIVRAGITWLSRQGLIQAGDNTQKDLIMSLNAEAHKWQELHEDALAQHEQTKRLLVALQIQNAMLKMLLKQHGVSTEEIAEAIEAIEKEFAPKSRSSDK